MHDSSTSATAASCASCGADVPGSFCANCGEKRFDPHSLSLAHFFEHAFEAFVHFDGTIFRTLRKLIFDPGRLTADYARGCRKPYLAPVQLFLLMNVLYFALAVGTTLNANLWTHLNRSPYQTMARSWVEGRLAERGTAMEVYREKFDAKANTQAKSLAILMVPLFAAAVAGVRWLTSRRGRRYQAVEHLVFSVHFYAFFLLAITIFSRLADASLRLLARWDVQPTPASVDATTGWVAALILAGYLVPAAHATGADPWWRAVLQGLLFTGAVFAVVLLYRLLLFMIGFATS